MQDKVNLKIDWASHKAANYACKNWHYSKVTPAGKLVKIGVWENGGFIGVVLFGRGANNNMSKAYGLKQTEACELVRIALTKHKTPVSRIVRIAINFLKKVSPSLKLIISYADPEQGHHGGVYQAGNWIYAGTTKPQKELLINGVHTHKRSAFSRFGTASPARIKELTGLDAKYGKPEFKHIYLMPLTQATKKKYAKLSKPYPKRVTKANSGDQLESGGAIPTHTLQSFEVQQ